MLRNVLIGQLLWGSFVIGYLRGPASMSLYEGLQGTALALALSLIVSRLLARRRRERSALWAVRLSERDKMCRVVRFEGYVTIGDEVVLDEAVQTADRDNGRLLLRYLDPRFSGPVLRELGGETEALDRLQAVLLPKAEPEPKDSSESDVLPEA